LGRVMEGDRGDNAGKGPSKETATNIERTTTLWGLAGQERLRRQDLSEELV